MGLPNQIGPLLSKSAKARSGFALLITIVLVAFLVLILVGLASFTRVETQVATNAQAVVQSRQYALMGMNIALGQLQRYAGSDNRITAQANLISSNNLENPWFTGVWNADDEGTQPLAWLVSGNETNPLLINATTALGRQNDSPEVPLELDSSGVATNGPNAASPNRVLMVSGGSAGTTGTGMAHGGVVVPGVPLESTPPGFAGVRTTGRYAYWVSDQGVKTPFAPSDSFEQINYAPYTAVESRNRLNQRLAADSSPKEFDPRASLNRSRVNRLLSVPQLAFMEFSSLEGEASAEAAARARFHDWSVGNYGVLANTLTDPDATKRGLRRDLSVNPAELGSAFVAFSNFDAYMEQPGTITPGTPAPEPAILAESMRRRHRITPPVVSQGWQHGIAPVLTSFIMQFNVRTVNGNVTPNLEVRSRYLMGLWNPYTSSLVPEPLILELEGLPTLTVTTPAGSAEVRLQDLFGGGTAAPMRIKLPFEEVNPSFQGDPDDRSWLPGRLYYWRTRGGTVGDWDSEFYNRTLAVSNANLWTVPAGTLPPPVTGATPFGVSGPSTTLRLTIKRASDDAVLGVFTSPIFDAFTVPERPVNSNNEYRVTFPFRLAESFDTVATDPSLWLTTAGRDPREPNLGLGVYLPFGSGGADPSASSYVGTTIPISAPDRLLDRVMGASGMSFNEDVPIFELPRQPFLSVGELQHLARPGARPFSVGNPWGAGEPNKLFDRYFFSGLVPGTTPNLAIKQPLPNPHLLPLEYKPNGNAVALEDLQSASNGGLGSKYLLQGAAFNVNSTSAAAWRSVLRGVRFTASQPFDYVQATEAKGGPVTDTSKANPPLIAEEAAFLRFPQSAQETYAATLPLGTSTYGATNRLPSQVPNPVSLANTHLFRRGVRVLTSEELDLFAAAIASNIRSKGEVSGPFRSLEEFLGPISEAPFNNQSLLQKAIADTDLNEDIDEFSSQFLTQADVISGLAPRLFARSDTFLIRSYGEVLNPATGESVTKTWCEAMVQRIPTPVDAANLTQPTDEEYILPPGNFGRAFKILSFRWLSQSDI